MGSNPRTIRQHARPYVSIWPDGSALGKIDVSPYVVGFSYTKAMHQAMGQWSITLVPWQGTKGPAHIGRSTQLEAICRPNAVVSIGMEERGGICIGLVDQVMPTRVLIGGSASYGIALHGSDFGKVLAQDHIVHASLTVADAPLFLNDIAAVAGPDHALVAALPGVWGPGSRDGVPTFLNASVSDVVDWLLKTAPSMRVPLLSTLGGSGKPAEFIATDGSITTWNGGRVWSEAPHTFNGSLWDFIRKILDEDFYELFIDSLPFRALSNVPSDIPDIRLTIRPKPFDELALLALPVIEQPGISWESLRTRIDGKLHHEIPQEAVLNEQLGISDADVFSYYLVSSEHELIGNPDGLAEGLFYPAVDLHALQRAGLRSYEGRLSLVASDLVRKQAGLLDYDLEVSQAVIEARNRLVNWYRLSEYFESGSITVAGSDRYRIGDPVYLPWRVPMRGFLPGTRYYCISTTHAWTLGAPYTTTMRLTRGHNQSSIITANADIAAAGAPFGIPNMLTTT